METTPYVKAPNGEEIPLGSGLKAIFEGKTNCQEEEACEIASIMFTEKDDTVFQPYIKRPLFKGYFIRQVYNVYQDNQSTIRWYIGIERYDKKKRYYKRLFQLRFSITFKECSKTTYAEKQNFLDI